MAHAVASQTVVGIAEIRRNLERLLQRVLAGKEHLVVEQAGTPVAAVINMGDYVEFRRWQASKLLRELGPQMAVYADASGLTEDVLTQLLEEDRAAVYHTLYEPHH